MSGLVPDNPNVDAAYWLQWKGSHLIVVRWSAAARQWAFHPHYGRVPVSDPGFLHDRGWRFAKVGDAECRHPIPGPAALLRMHAPDREMVRAALIREVPTDTYEVMYGGIFAAMLKEALKCE